MKNVLTLAMILFAAVSCKQEKAQEFTYWVNGTQITCMGVAPRKCLQVQKGEELNEQAWKSFSSKIDGFDYEPGYVYKLKVKEEKIPAEQVPADASSIKYTLVKVLKKTADARFAIDGDWTLIRLNAQPINRMVPAPTLAIHVADMQIAGSGGCNNYAGGIKNLTTKEIVLGQVAGTRKACFKKNIEQDYLVALNKVHTYAMEDGKLVFYDEAGTEVLAFFQ
ncbi:MAG: DUF4377 domain-containing protein [Mangrovibacterium sp.]